MAKFCGFLLTQAVCVWAEPQSATASEGESEREGGGDGDGREREVEEELQEVAAEICFERSAANPRLINNIKKLSAKQVQYVL